VPAKTVSFSGLGGTATVEETIRVQGQTDTTAAVYDTQGGLLAADLTYFPLYIFPSRKKKKGGFSRKPGEAAAQFLIRKLFCRPLV